MTGPIIGVSRRAHRVGSGRRDVAFFEAKLSGIEQLRLIIIGATLGVVVGILVIVPGDFSRSDVSGTDRSSPATPPPTRTFVGPARSPAPGLASQRPPDPTASVAPTQRELTPAPARTPVPTIAAPSTPVPAASAAATAAPTVPSAQPTPTSAPTSLIPTLPPLPTLPSPTLPSLP